MDKFQAVFLLGWGFNLLTLTVFYLTKDEFKQRLLMVLFNGISLGIFICYGILRWC
jgi:hypothetical protein